MKTKEIGNYKNSNISCKNPFDNPGLKKIKPDVMRTNDSSIDATVKNINMKVRSCLETKKARLHIA